MLLTLLGGCMVTTVGLSNVVWVLMFANWLLEGRWAEKWQMARKSRLLQAFAALFLLHVVGLLWTSNMAEGLHIVERMLPLMAVPLVVLTTPPPEGNTRRFILSFYTCTVFVVTVIGFVRWLTIPDLPHREIITYISHIRFSLNVCMAIYLVLLNLRRGADMARHVPTEGPRHPSPFTFHLSPRFTIYHSSFITIFLLLWFLFFLLILQSYTAFVVLAVASLVAIFIIHHSSFDIHHSSFIIIFPLFTLLVLLMLFLGCRSYYHLSPHASQPLPEYTANGRPYEHRQDGFIENGNYVNNYLCFEELRREWPHRSTVALDSLTPSGYPVEASLIRYLNALSLPKDSAGIAALSDSQVEEIARGVANPVYEHGTPLQKMLYVSLFEYENYRCYNAVMGFTMLQRFELWKCAWQLILKNPLLGTGTGDLHDEMHDLFVATDSPMQHQKLSPHNEYLTLPALFGLPAFLLLLFLFLRVRPIKHSSNQAIKHSSNQAIKTLNLLWLVTILISFITENTLDSLAGILFCTWFLAFRHNFE